MNNVIVDGLEFEPFIYEEQIKKRIHSIAKHINEKHRDSKPVFIGVLNGCFMFFSDLLKEITIPCETSFVKLASYSGTQGGDIKQLLGVGLNIVDRHVIVVEDIIDTGNSMKHMVDMLLQKNVLSITLCSLLLKPACLQQVFDSELHVGFEVDKDFVVGYGLDYNGYGRNLRHVYRVVR